MQKGGAKVKRRLSVSLAAVAALTVTALLTFGVTTAGSTPAAHKADKVRVALVFAANIDLPPQIGVLKGFFKKQGLDVTLGTPDVPFSSLPTTLGKQYDIVVGTQPDLIRAASSGLGVVAISGIQRDNPADPGAALIVPPDSSIKSIKDIGGKTVGAPSTVGNNWTTLLCWAKKGGADPNSIRGVQAATPTIPDLLKANRFNAALIFQPLMGPLLAEGYKNVGDSYAKCFGGKELTAIWVAKGDWASANPDVVSRFLAGLKEATAWMGAHPKESRAIWLKVSGLPSAVSQRTPIIASEFDYQQGKPLVTDMAKWIALLKSLNLYNGSVDPATLVYTP
jgi:NitT/TauT family transport system substrate-binding protein